MADRIRVLGEQLKENRKIHVGLTIFIALLLLYLVIFKWHLPQYKLLKETGHELQIEVDQIKQTYNTPLQELEQTLRSKGSQLEEQLWPFQWQVLDGEPLLILANQAEIKDRDFKITSLSQGDSQKREEIWSVPFTIEASGKEQSIHSYLTYLDQQPKALVPYRMSLFYHDVLTKSSREYLELELELELAALGIEQGIGQLPPDLESNRGDIFSPTVALPETRHQEEVGKTEETPETIQPRLPSYSFPSKNEVRPSHDIGGT